MEVIGLVHYIDLLFRGGVIGISTGLEKVIKGGVIGISTGVGRDSYTPP